MRGRERDQECLQLMIKTKKLQGDFAVLLVVKTAQIIFIYLDFSINQYSEQSCALFTEIAKMA